MTWTLFSLFFLAYSNSPLQQSVTPVFFRHSCESKNLWIPAFMGMTDFYSAIISVPVKILFRNLLPIFQKNQWYL